MKTGLKRGLVLGMSLCLAAASLAACGKKAELDTTATIAALDGENVTAGVANFLLRYQQTQFESSYGGWLKSYYGDNLWNMDLMGTGELYGDTFKNEIMTELERMLLAEKHMADYGVELTDEEKAAIAEAAKTFISENEEEVLEKMSATQENVERVMTLYTIRNKMEHSMSADVNTEVSDEEAAQRTVSYVRFDTKEASEESAEDETAGIDGEADTENPTEEGTDSEVLTEGSDAQDSESESEGAAEESTEVNTEAALTEVENTKTETADTEEPETEAGTEEITEAGTEAAEETTETGSEADTETSSEEATEAVTEDEATRLAKEEARARAEAFLAEAKNAENFAEAAAAVTEKDTDSSTSSYTFGEDDTYPDEAIITATKGLEDNTLVEEVVEVNDSYYVLYVEDAFDEEAVAEKKDEIVAQRKLDAINALYEEWTEASEFTVEEKVLDQLGFDLSLTVETEASTEQETVVEETEITTEVTAETGTEAETEADTEAGTEAETGSGAEVDTEAKTEAESEVDTEAKSEGDSETETVTETATEAE